MVRTLSLALVGLLVVGCASGGKKETPPPATEETPAQGGGGKVAAPMEVTLTARPGATAQQVQLDVEVMAQRDLPAVEVVFHLPAGVTMGDAAANLRKDAMKKGEKQLFTVQATLADEVVASGADASAEVVVPWGGVNKDTVTRVVRLGAPAAAAAPSGATGKDGTGKGVREARPGH